MIKKFQRIRGMIHRHLLNKSDAGTPSTYSPRVRKERHDYKRDNILLIVAIHDHCRNFCTHRRLDGMCAMFDKCPLNKHVTDINHDNRAIAPKPENTL